MWISLDIPLANLTNLQISPLFFETYYSHFFSNITNLATLFVGLSTQLSAAIHLPHQHAYVDVCWDFCSKPHKPSSKLTPPTSANFVKNPSTLLARFSLQFSEIPQPYSLAFPLNFVSNLYVNLSGDSSRNPHNPSSKDSPTSANFISNPTKLFDRFSPYILREIHLWSPEIVVNTFRENWQALWWESMPNASSLVLQKAMKSWHYMPCLRQKRWNCLSIGSLNCFRGQCNMESHSNRGSRSKNEQDMRKYGRISGAEDKEKEWGQVTGGDGKQ